ncbi:MAG: hypothetical protein EOR25_29680 [Mesorhizobium sp.]|uniref:hypothetical protein n=1 Tax=Mesorhizobium sp. TaxID=1871066 RepID=UPI000FE29E24|nr:hypothetical protein [Mesorhizobium sp.]RWJ04849.1 MAG: hypothetical protein EOR24_29675 [Mesorhizobium sp.]RWJ11999.1 MAG: hypothetical protein EOR25_29680 [Mesorhizobium sp.]
MEYFEFNLTDVGEIEIDRALPTACLIIADTREVTDLQVIVDKMITIGCTFFMSAGKYADGLEEQIDSIVEGSDVYRSLGVVTTSHVGETPEDIVSFLFNATLPSETAIRCCVGYEETATAVERFLAEARILASAGDPQLLG